MRSAKEKSKKINELYEIYGKEKVLLCIRQIDPRNSDILIKYLDGEFSVKQIAEIYNLTDIGVYKIIEKELLRVEKILMNPELNAESMKNRKMTPLIRFFSKHGKERVLEEINKLNESDRRLICFYYEMNLGTLKFDEIKEFSDDNPKTMYVKVKKILQSIEYRIEKNDNVRKPQKNTKLERLYEIYGTEKIKYLISCLPPKSREIMELYLGGENEFPQSPKKISEITGITMGSVTTIVWQNIKKIEEMAENPQIADDNMNNERRRGLERIYKKYGENNVREEVNRMVELEKNVISSYYGLNGKKIMSIMEIADEYKLDVQEAKKMIVKTNYYIKKVLQYKKDIHLELNKRYLDIASQYEMDDIYLAMQSLDAGDLDILRDFIGIKRKRKNIKEIASKHGITETDAIDAVKRSFDGICVAMDDTPFEIRKLMHVYGKRTVRNAFNKLDSEDLEVIHNYKKKRDNYDEFLEVVTKLEKQLSKLYGRK